MTCQACQTWNSDDDHRCRRCGRRFRVTPTRHARNSYPIAASALAYQPEAIEDDQPLPTPQGEGQQILFLNPNEGRVIPFDQLTSPGERESIRARAARLSQPSPVKSGKVEVSARKRSKSEDQQQFDFFGKPENQRAPLSAIQCGAPVATPFLRLNAALVDGFMVLLATFVFMVAFRLITGALPLEKFALIGYGIAFVAIFVSYKLLWCFANRDSFGVTAARLRLVDFDGNRPTQKHRFGRAFSSLLSLGAAGLGLIWTFADADSLAWHDQISGTFPTFND